MLSWVHFINSTSTVLSSMDTDDEEEETVNRKLEAALAYIHGACLVFLDGLGSGTNTRWYMLHKKGVKSYAAGG